MIENKLDRTYLYQSVADCIQEYIASNELQPGDRLPSTQSLCKSLGVGRTSIREGLRLLETAGIVQIRSGSGVFVADFSLGPLIREAAHYLIGNPSETAVKELLEIRSILELEATKLAAEKIQDNDLTLLYEIVERAESKVKRGLKVRAEDAAFHEAIYRLSGNGVFRRLAELVTSLLYRIQDASSDSPVDAFSATQIAADLRKVTEALQDRDSRTAISAMNDHLRKVDDFFAKIPPAGAGGKSSSAKEC